MDSVLSNIKVGSTAVGPPVDTAMADVMPTANTGAQGEDKKAKKLRKEEKRLQKEKKKQVEAGTLDIDDGIVKSIDDEQSEKKKRKQEKKRKLEAEEKSTKMDVDSGEEKKKKRKKHKHGKD